MKIVFIVPNVPFPLEKGHKLRAYHQLTRLSLSHNVTLVALNPGGSVHENARQELKPYCTKLHILNIPRLHVIYNVIKAFFTGVPYQVAYYYRESTKKQLQQIIEQENPDVIYCQLLRTAEYVKDITKYPKVLDYMSVISRSVRKQIKHANFFYKPFVNIEYKRLKKYETDIFEQFHSCTIISRQDRLLIPHPRNFEAEIIPNGVDAAYFKPQPLVHKKYDLIFAGNLNYPPNVYSAEFLVNSVLPLIRKSHPDLKVLIAGPKPSRRVRLLAEDPSVKVIAWSEDLRACYAESRIFVAPMQGGSGMQNKLLEAMAMQIPCITSSLSAKTLGATSGVELLTGVTAADYASQIIYLLSNPEKAEDFGKAGNAFVKEYYNWNKVNAHLETTFKIAQKFFNLKSIGDKTTMIHK